MPFHLNLNFQEFNNFNMMNMMFFSDNLNNTMMMIFILMMILILNLISKKSFNSKKLKESSTVELFWTVLPSFVILFLSIPSISSLYLMEEFKKPCLDLNIMGNQWYWNYSFSSKYSFPCYLKESLINRNIATDYSVFLPSSSFIRLNISSNDVIHSWTIPSLMSKSDAIPGRINTLSIFCSKSVKTKGQCSEICGMNHSFMPISLIFLK